MTANGADKYSAADAGLGYLYQCRVALVMALRRIRAGEEFLVTLETLDDVAFESLGDPPTLLQTKHHRARKADLTDASTDIWKTLRIWSEGFAAGTTPASSSLNLITTSTAPVGSAASYLRLDGRDEVAAGARLEATSRTSTNADNQKAYTAFLGLTPKLRRDLLHAITILDGAGGILDLDEELSAEIRWAVDRKHIPAFLARLEGWWFRRAIRHLSAGASDPVLSKEFEAEVDDLREQFKRDALPIDEDILAAGVNAADYTDAVFVKQLQMIGVGAQRVLAAVREYYRAFEHRSRWLREDLLLVGELESYERQLIEEWTLVFERMKDDLGQQAAEERKQTAAREVYRWVETTVIPIRPSVTAPFVTRGSYQLLADQLRVGWHPEFMARLQHLLGGQPGAP